MQFPPLDANLSCSLCSLPGAWQPLISLSGLQRAGNGLLFWDNVKYNVPLHSWKHSALTASSLWATVGATYMITCQTETSISGAVMLVYNSERRGESPEDLWENKHLSHSRFTKTHLRLPNTTWEIFYHLLKHMWKYTSECVRGDSESDGEPRRRASSPFPLERTGVKHLHHRSAWAQQIHSLKISSSIRMIKATADKPTRITVCEFTPSQTHVRN